MAFVLMSFQKQRLKGFIYAYFKYKVRATAYILMQVGVAQCAQ